MRFFAFMLFFLAFFAMQAQTTTVVLDTLYYEKGYNSDLGDSTYFVVKEIQFSNGAIDRKRDIIGDTAAVINHGNALSSQMIDQLRASAVNVIFKAERFVKPVLDISSTLNSMFGVNLVQLNKDQYGPLIEGNCSVRVSGGTVVQGTITKNKSGNYILNATGVNSKQIIPLYGKMIRVLQYPTAGQNTDLFQTFDNGKVFISVDRSLVVVVK